MNHSKVIAITLHRRPEATLRLLLDSLRQCYGIEDYTVIMSVDIAPDEHGQDRGDCGQVLAMAKTFAGSNIAKRVFIHEHRPALGIDSNKIFALRMAYRHSDTPIFLHDDNPLSKDGLRWFEFANEKFANDRSIWGVTSYSRRVGRPFDQIAPYSYGLRKGHLAGECWGMSYKRDIFFDCFGDSFDSPEYKAYVDWARNMFGFGHENGAYDHYLMNHKLVALMNVYPILSRSLHSEWEFAHHTQKQHWIDHEDVSNCWAGMLPDRDPESTDWEFVGA